MIDVEKWVNIAVMKYVNDVLRTFISFSNLFFASPPAPGQSQRNLDDGVRRFIKQMCIAWSLKETQLNNNSFIVDINRNNWYTEQ